MTGETGFARGQALPAAEATDRLREAEAQQRTIQQDRLAALERLERVEKTLARAQKEQQLLREWIEACDKQLQIAARAQSQARDREE